METEWLTLAKQEDEQAFLKLRTAYAPLLRRQVAWAMNRLPQNLLQDCRQEALLAFHRAVMTYSQDQTSVTFGLYAKVCIKNRLCSFLRKQERQSSLRSIPDTDLVLNVATKNEISEIKGYGERLQSLRASLSAFECRVLDRLLAGEKPAQIATSLCKTQKSVYNALSRIRGKRKGMSQM